MKSCAMSQDISASGTIQKPALRNAVEKAQLSETIILNYKICYYESNHCSVTPAAWLIQKSMESCTVPRAITTLNITHV